MTRVAIIGTGWGARVQLPIFQQAGMEIAALGANSEEKARRMAAELSIPFAGTDYLEIIARPDTELISITTPPRTHADLATAALKAGKHVLCEKPIALDAGAAERMLAAARAHPRQLALIDYQLRFLPTHQKMKTLIQDGYVGKVFYLEATVTEGTMLNLGIPWHWWHDQEEGGGYLGAVGSHLIDLIAWLLNRLVTKVDGLLSTFVRERADAAGVVHPVTSDDFFLLQLRFGGEIIGIIKGSSVTSGQPIHRLVIAGSDGRLEYEAGQLIGCRSDCDQSEVLMVEEEIEIPNKLSKTEFVRGTSYLARALNVALQNGDHTGLQPAASFADGVRVQYVMDAVRRSHADAQ